MLAVHPLLGFVSPEGWRVYSFVIDHYRNSDAIRRLIREWQPPGHEGSTLAGLPLHVLGFVGLFSFQMNWASGAMLIQWMALQIIGFWMAKGPSRFDPLFINATVPIGALLILAGLAARKPKA